MSIEPAPKIFLQNKLRRCREELHELTPVINSKRGFFKCIDKVNVKVQYVT